MKSINVNNLMKALARTTAAVAAGAIMWGIILSPIGAGADVIGLYDEGHPRYGLVYQPGPDLSRVEFDDGGYLRYGLVY
jgi:hypothetical protein